VALVALINDQCLSQRAGYPPNSLSVVMNCALQGSKLPERQASAWVDVQQRQSIPCGIRKPFKAVRHRIDSHLLEGAP
jgi:hypothetical protein